MKTIITTLFALWSFSPFGMAEEKNDRSLEIPLQPLIVAMDEGGLEGVVSFLDKGGKWPRITTDSFASKNEIANQKDLVGLSDRLLHMLRDRAAAESPTGIGALEKDAGMLFSLGGRLWESDGYRNRAMALVCSEFASYRCAQIILLSKGENMGPARPGIFKVRSSKDMLALFVSLIPENAQLADSGLGKNLVQEPVAGETWIEMLAALRKIELGEGTVGVRFDESVTLGMALTGRIVSSENISALVFHQGWAQVIHESMLPALAMYLKNDGSLETLLSEPTNAKKFKDVMKDGFYRFSEAPVMNGRVGEGELSGLVAGIQSPNGIFLRLFGSEK